MLSNSKTLTPEKLKTYMSISISCYGLDSEFTLASLRSQPAVLFSGFPKGFESVVLRSFRDLEIKCKKNDSKYAIRIF